MDFTKEELKVLNKVAKEVFGIAYKDLDDEDKDYIYCYAEENGRI